MLGISMTGSTLAGLMNSKIKFAVDQNMPIINKLNPAALITDAFYCINVDDDPVRMKTNLATPAYGLWYWTMVHFCSESLP